MTTLALSAVDVNRAGMASAVLNAARQIGQVFGVAVLGALVYAHLPGRAGGQLDGGQRQLFVAGLHAALLVSGVALIAAALVISPLLWAPTVRFRGWPSHAAAGRSGLPRRHRQ
jgi:DHA2 family methylenomycin A resistance protein-like MFS transporter